MSTEQIERMKSRFDARLTPTQREIQTHVDRLREKDRTIGWNVEAGQFRLVSVTYDDAGDSTVNTIIGPLAEDEFLSAVEAM